MCVRVRSLVLLLLCGGVLTACARGPIPERGFGYSPAYSAQADEFNRTRRVASARTFRRARRRAASGGGVRIARVPYERKRARVNVRPHRKIGQRYYAYGRWFRPRHQPNYVQTGYASWYGQERQGRYTANGEIFDATVFSGGHPTLPLPCYVEVTNLRNGARAVVRINDRGPFVRGRIIGLSASAASALGLYRRGTARVRARYLGPAPLPGERSVNRIRPGLVRAARGNSRGAGVRKLGKYQNRRTRY